ncbi:hypothetical protein [Ferruginibacter sp.]
MKYFLFLSLILLLSSCGPDTFINHKLEVTKLGDCTNEAVPVKIGANTIGERYEFEYCLEDGYDGKNYTVERSGDSLLVKFPAVKQKPALYKLVLDIDAKPAYHHIKLGDQIVLIVSTERL